MTHKRLWMGLLAAVIITALALSAVGCAKTDAPEKPSSEQPATAPEEESVAYDAAEDMIKAANGYLKSSPVPTISAEDLYTIVQTKDPGYQIVDIRDTKHYFGGHVPGSENTPFNITYTDEVLNRLDSTKKQIIVCYTGHTASQTNMLFNMLGYDALTLKYGMAGWSNEPVIVGIDIPEAVAKNATKPTVTEVSESSGGFGVPKIEGYKDVKSAIQGQAKKYFDAKVPPTISADDVFTMVQAKDPGIQIIDVRKAEDYAKGHVEGAINILWTDIADNLDKIDPDKKIIVYCYTGHTAGEASMFLQLMGYDAINMKFGMSGWQADPALGGAEGYDPLNTPNYNSSTGDN